MVMVVEMLGVPSSMFLVALCCTPIFVYTGSLRVVVVDPLFKHDQYLKQLTCLRGRVLVHNNDLCIITNQKFN